MTKYVPSSISSVSIPMTARLASICASSRNARCRSTIAASATAVSAGRSSSVASRLENSLTGGPYPLVTSAPLAGQSRTRPGRTGGIAERKGEQMTDANGALEGFRSTFSGEVILPGDPRYDESREVFNAMIDRRPTVIARCSSAADVAAAVDFAREQNLVVAVRGGGHSVAGLSVCDGLMIDLGGVKQIDVDPAAKTARAGGGV